MIDREWMEKQTMLDAEWKRKVEAEDLEWRKHWFRRNWRVWLYFFALGVVLGFVLPMLP